MYIYAVVRGTRKQLKNRKWPLATLDGNSVVNRTGVN